MENKITFRNQLEKSSWPKFYALLRRASTSYIDDPRVKKTIFKIKAMCLALNILFKSMDNYANDSVSLSFFKVFDSLLDENITILKNQQLDVLSADKIKFYIETKLIPFLIEEEIFSRSDYTKLLDNSERRQATLDLKLEQTQSDAAKNLRLIKIHKSELEEVLNQAKTSRDKIIALERELLGSSGESGSVKMKITEIYNTLESKRAAIVDFHDKLTKGDTAESSIELQINTAKDKAVETAKKLAQRYDETHEIFENLNAFHDKIFGKKDAVGNSIGGLEQEFDHKRKTLDDITDEHKKVYEAQVVEIENLLPGATSAGLSDAFSKMRLSFDKPIKWYSGIFYFALAGIFMCGAILVVKSISSAGIEFNQYSNPQQLLNNLLLKLPFLIPLLWLAIFASKRRSENIRLQQEYAHKEVIAKSYEGFKKQITDLGGKNDQLMVELIAKAIIALSFNPSTTLDGKHGDKPPFIAAVEKLITRAEKLVPENKVSKEK